MTSLDSVLFDFRAAFAAVDEQHAPFTAPTPAEIARAREGVEEIKRRNREATPVIKAVASHEGGNEL